MEEIEKNGDSLLSPRNFYIISVYFLFAGSLYLWGYWSHFGINILEYIGVTDIIKITAFPMAVSIVAILISIAITDVFRRSIFFEMILTATASDVYTRDNLKNRNFFKKILLLIFVISIPYLFIFLDGYQWIIFSCLATYALAMRLICARLILRLIIDPWLRTAFVLVSVGIPVFTFGVAKLDANLIRHGKNYSYVISEFAGNVPLDNYEKQLRYIGSAGDYIFLFNPKNDSVIISKYKEDEVLAIKQYRHSQAQRDKFRNFLKSIAP